MKKVVLLGIRNFDFFSSDLLNSIDLIIVCSNAADVPSQLSSKAHVIVIQTHYNSQSRCFEMAPEEVFSLLQQHLDITEINAVFCNQEANLVTARRLRQLLNIKEPLNCDIERFRNKLVMKGIVAEHGLRVPHFANDVGRSHVVLASKLGIPYIIKPCASVGSRGVFKIYHQSDFDLFLQETANEDCIYQAEEYIDGILYHCDMVIQNRQFLFQYSCQYSCPNAEFQNGKILGSFLVQPKSAIAEKLKIFAGNCMQALGEPDGCFHMEIFIKSDGEPVFLEVAARSPGLSIVPIYQSWLGVNLYDAELSIQIGEDASPLFKTSPDFIPLPMFYAVLPKKAGTISQLNDPEIRSQYKLNWNVTLGETLGNTTTNLDFAGKLLVTNSSADDLAFDWDYICNKFEPLSYT